MAFKLISIDYNLDLITLMIAGVIEFQQRKDLMNFNHYNVLEFYLILVI